MSDSTGKSEQDLRDAFGLEVFGSKVFSLPPDLIASFEIGIELELGVGNRFGYHWGRL